jgi:hypothetical protein
MATSTILKKLSIATAGAVLFNLGISSVVQAATFVENFNAPFPAWESGWLGTNSNIKNYYGQGQGRGNNPDGLWLTDGDGMEFGDPSVDIVFDSLFGSTLTSLSIDIAGYSPTKFQVFDKNNNSLLNVDVTLTYGATTFSGVYSSYSITSTNGISRFSFVPTNAGSVEGNTSIDNLVVTQSSTQTVPEPSYILGLLAFGVFGASSMLKRKQLYSSTQESAH